LANQAFLFLTSFINLILIKMETNFLTRDLLLQKDDLKIEKVELSRGHVFVREMTGREKDIWEQSMLKQKPSGDRNRGIEYETTLEDFRAKLAVVTICDSEGNLLFEQKDVKNLNKVMSASNMEKIISVAQRLNAITESDKEEVLKNSETVPENNTSSGSVVS
jgi:hypothetical protein